MALDAVPDAGTSWKRIVERFRYVAGEYAAPDTFDRLQDVLDRGRPRRTAPRATASTTWPPCPRSSPWWPRRWPSTAATGPGTDGAFARLVVEKPFGRDLPSALALDDAVHRAFDEEPGLPHRPLHGQRDGAERPGPALRQRHLRAHLEPPLRRAGPDHGGRELGCRAPGRLLRDGRGAARHRPEPRHAGPGPHPDGAAHRDGRPAHPRREGQAAAGDRDPDARRGGGPSRAGPVRGRGDRRDPSCPATARRRASTPASRTETYVALRLGSRTGAGPACPIYVRTGKRLPTRVHRGGPAVPPRAVPRLRGRADPGPAPNTLVLRIQPDEGISLHFGAKVPGDAFRVQSVAMDFRYDVRLPGRQRPTATSGSSTTPWSATPPCSSGATRSSRPGGSSTPTSRRGPSPAVGLALLPGGDLGPAHGRPPARSGTGDSWSGAAVHGAVKE